MQILFKNFIHHTRFKKKFTQLDPYQKKLNLIQKLIKAIIFTLPSKKN